MSEMKPMKQQKVCPNCGAPIVSGNCQYCGVTTGLNAEQYPVLECKSAALTSTTCFMPLFVGLFFGMGELCVVVILIMGGKNIPLALSLIPLGFVSAYFLFSFGRTVWRYTTVKKKGTHMQGVILSYEDSTMSIDHEPTKVAKILLDTPLGPGMISYETYKVDYEYGLNTSIDLMVYGDYYLML